MNPEDEILWFIAVIGWIAVVFLAAFWFTLDWLLLARTGGITMNRLKSVKIDGLPGTWSQIESRYDYEKDKCKCPACGGIGIPWAGWFNCENCSCKAVVADGRAFLPDKAGRSET